MQRFVAFEKCLMDGIDCSSEDLRREAQDYWSAGKTADLKLDSGLGPFASGLALGC